MTTIILKPDPDVKRKWGILAHVPEHERDEILALPHAQFKPKVKWLEKELKAAQKQPRPLILTPREGL